MILYINYNIKKRMSFLPSVPSGGTWSSLNEGKGGDFWTIGGPAKIDPLLDEAYLERKNAFESPWFPEGKKQQDVAPPSSNEKKVKSTLVSNYYLRSRYVP